ERRAGYPDIGGVLAAIAREGIAAEHDAEGSEMRPVKRRGEMPVARGQATGERAGRQRSQPLAATVQAEESAGDAPIRAGDWQDFARLARKTVRGGPGERRFAGSGPGKRAGFDAIDRPARAGLFRGQRYGHGSPLARAASVRSLTMR